MTDIFISYARGDREWVKMLADSLREKGYSVWWDRDIPPGVIFDDFIEEKLKVAQCIIVVWSKASTISRWVRAEASEGVTRNNLVPVLMENIKVPLAFRHIQTADLTDWIGQENHEVLQSIFRQIEIIIRENNTKKLSNKNQDIIESNSLKENDQHEVRVHLKINKIFNDKPTQFQLIIDKQTVWHDSLESHDGLIYEGHIKNGIHSITFLTSSDGGFTTSKKIDFDSDKDICIRVKKSWWDAKQTIEIQ